MTSPLLTFALALDAGEIDTEALATLRADAPGTRAQLNAVMEEILRLGPECCENGDLVAQAYALMPLLAELGDTECLDPLIRFLALPPEAHDALIGDLGLDIERTVIACCSLRDPARLLALASDGSQPPVHRRIALDGVCHHTAYGRIPVADAVFAATAFFHQLIPQAKAKTDPKDFIISGEIETAARNLCDILPHALRGELEAVVHSGVCYKQFFSQSDVDHCLGISDEKNMESYRMTYADTFPADDIINGYFDESAEQDRAPAKPEPIRKLAKIGRNDPCPCGSGKKYKKCCEA